MVNGKMLLMVFGRSIFRVLEMNFFIIEFELGKEIIVNLILIVKFVLENLRNDIYIFI